jgi:hypothetical protein
VYKRRRWEVASAVGNKPLAIGAVAGFNPDSLRAVVVGYDTIPQDVLVVTGELRSHADLLRELIPRLFLPDSSGVVPGAPLAQSTFAISGVVPFDAPFRSMYNELARKDSLVRLERPSGLLDQVLRSIAALKSGVEQFNGFLASVLALLGTIGALAVSLGLKRSRAEKEKSANPE